MRRALVIILLSAAASASTMQSLQQLVENRAPIFEPISEVDTSYSDMIRTVNDSVNEALNLAINRGDLTSLMVDAFTKPYPKLNGFTPSTAQGLEDNIFKAGMTELSQTTFPGWEKVLATARHEFGKFLMTNERGLEEVDMTFVKKLVLRWKQGVTDLPAPFSSKAKFRLLPQIDAFGTELEAACDEVLEDYTARFNLRLNGFYFVRIEALIIVQAAALEKAFLAGDSAPQAVLRFTQLVRAMPALYKFSNQDLAKALNGFKTLLTSDLRDYKILNPKAPQNDPYFFFNSQATAAITDLIEKNTSKLI